jgi:AcrR family transcriptional regulator
LPRVLLEPEVRREQLLTAAASVFAQKGFHPASVTDIIQAAGCARGTFYLYFEGKQAVFLALVDRWFEAVERQMLQPPPQAPATAEAAAIQMRADLRKWFGFVREHREMTQVVLREAVAVDPAVSQRVDALMRRSDDSRRGFLLLLQELGLLRRELDVDVLNACLGGTFREVTLRFATAEAPLDIDWLTEQVQSFVETGIGPSPASFA